jgi:hypothetical protein
LFPRMSFTICSNSTGSITQCRSDRTCVLEYGETRRKAREKAPQIETPGCISKKTSGSVLNGLKRGFDGRRRRRARSRTMQGRHFSVDKLQWFNSTFSARHVI